MSLEHRDDRTAVYLGDCVGMTRYWPDNCVDSIVTDPPYELGFMGKNWDSSGIAYSVELWREVLRVLKPGGHLLAFGGTRTYHRLAVAVEDAGFEIRDSIIWLYGQGFPAGDMNVSKAIDKAAGAVREVVGEYQVSREWSRNRTEGRDGVFNDRSNGVTASTAVLVDITAPATPEAQQWDGWHTRLKPAHEPIVVARKPFKGSVVSNVLAHGTGALNVDACRVGTEVRVNAPAGNGKAPSMLTGFATGGELHEGYNFKPDAAPTTATGRYPANVMLDEDAAGGLGSRAKYFYCPKPDTKERPQVNGVAHATVKPLALMRYLVRLVTPPDGVCLDPFAGSGTTLEACILEGFRGIGIEKDETHIPLIMARLERNRHAEVE